MDHRSSGEEGISPVGGGWSCDLCVATLGSYGVKLVGGEVGR